MFFSYINSVLKILCYNLAYFYEKPVFITILQQYNFRLNLPKKVIGQAKKNQFFPTNTEITISTYDDTAV
jgi:hypothetical protein